MPKFSFLGGTYEDSRVEGGVHKFMCFLIGNKREVPLWEAKSQGLVSLENYIPPATGWLQADGADRYQSYPSIPVYSTSFSIAKIMVYHKMPNRVNFSYSFFFYLANTGKEYSIRPNEDSVAESHGWRFIAEGRFLRTPELKTVVDVKSLTYRLAIQQGLPSKDVINRIISVKSLGEKVQECGLVGGKRLIRQRKTVLPLDPKRKESD